jgi:LacI family transcriptional regulator
MVYIECVTAYIRLGSMPSAESNQIPLVSPNSESERAVTIYDVARRAGVSVATVSRALNQSGFVKASTRQRILEAVSELGYVPNPLAKRLSGSQSGVWGLVVPELDDPYWSEVAQTIERSCREVGIVLLMVASHWSAQEESQAVRIVMRHRVDGVIFCVPSVLESVRTLRRHNIPVVVRGNCAEGAVEEVDQVMGDDYQGGYLATRHLLELGHRRITFIGLPERFGKVQPRYAGYQAALAEEGLTPHVCRWMNTTQQAQALAELAAILEDRAAPTAFVAASDYMAIRAWDLLEWCKRRVPDDISIVGHGNARYSRLIRCGLTTIEHGKEQQTQMVIRMLMERIAQTYTDVPRRELIPTTLIVRGSTRALT